MAVFPPNYAAQNDPSDYLTQNAEKSRREMAMALMNGPVQNRQPTHFLQPLGNMANTALGAHQMNKANEAGRGSDIYDATKDVNGRFGMRGTPAVPLTGGQSLPFQAGGSIPTQAQPGVGIQPPPMITTPQSGLPMPQMAGGPSGAPPSSPGMSGQMTGPGVPFPGAGGFPPGGGAGWPEMPQQNQSPWANLFGFNPQG